MSLIHFIFPFFLLLFLYSSLSLSLSLTLSYCFLESVFYKTLKLTHTETVTCILQITVKSTKHWHHHLLYVILFIISRRWVKSSLSLFKPILIHSFYSSFFLSSSPFVTRWFRHKVLQVSPCWVNSSLHWYFQYNNLSPHFSIPFFQCVHTTLHSVWVTSRVPSYLRHYPIFLFFIFFFQFHSLEN